MKGEVVIIRLKKPQKDALLRIRQLKGIPMSEQIRRAIDRYLESTE